MVSEQPGKTENGKGSAEFYHPLACQRTGSGRAEALQGDYGMQGRLGVCVMMRLVIDIYDGEDTQGTKEAVAMLLEPLGRVRVVSVIVDGKEEKR